MATTLGDGIKYEFMLGGGVPPLMKYPQQKDTTGWAVGCPLIFDASGHVTSISSGALVSASGTIGIAAHDSDKDSTADGSVDQMVILATPMTVFSAAVSNAGATTSVPAYTLLNNSYALTSEAAAAGSSLTWVLEIGTSGTDGGYVIGLKDTTDTAHGRVYFVMRRVYSTNSPYMDTT